MPKLSHICNFSVSMSISSPSLCRYSNPIPSIRPLLLSHHFSSLSTPPTKLRSLLSISLQSSFRSSHFEIRASHSDTIQTSHAKAFVVAVDERYGNKQVISVTPQLYNYILSNTREPEILRELREETATMRGSQMQVSPDQAQLLAMLVQILGAKRCIEVGVYTGPIHGNELNNLYVDSVLGNSFILSLKRHLGNVGQIHESLHASHEGKALDHALSMTGDDCLNSGYSTMSLHITGEGYSSLAVALVLPESGRLVAIERDAKCLEIAKRYYQRAGVSHKVDVKHALAVDALKSLILNGEACSYDFAFVDAEKRMYSEYFELLLQLVRVGGVIVIDNVLWHGKVADPLVNDPKTVSIRNFNKDLFEDKRVSISIVPIGDGIMICRKN